MAVMFAAQWAEGGGRPASPWKARLSLLEGGEAVSTLTPALHLELPHGHGRIQVLAHVRHIRSSIFQTFLASCPWLRGASPGSTSCRRPEGRVGISVGLGAVPPGRRLPERGDAPPILSTGPFTLLVDLVGRTSDRTRRCWLSRSTVCRVHREDSHGGG